MDTHKPSTKVFEERDAGKPKDVKLNASTTPDAESDPQFPGGEHPANDQPLPGKKPAQPE